jgi:hypothetical protein
VNEEAFDIAHKLPREPLAFGRSEFGDNEAVLEQAQLFFDGTPDPFVLVAGVPPSSNRAAVRLAKIG